MLEKKNYMKFALLLFLSHACEIYMSVIYGSHKTGTREFLFGIKEIIFHQKQKKERGKE